MKIRYALALMLAFVALPALAKDDPAAGHYRLSDGGPDVASELLLKPDGSFQYFLIAGALDEQAEGEWVRDGAVVRLTTRPEPKPPSFAQGAAMDAEDPYFILVTWPNGRGIAGIDLRIGFDDGDVIEDYTQEYGWSLPVDEKRKPRWIELAEPIHDLVSPRFSLDEAGRYRFILTPNDLGTLDLRGAPAMIEGERLTLTRPGGIMNFRRMATAKR